MNDTTAFYLAQCISILCGVLAIIMMQLKNMKTILAFQIIVNLTASLNYLILGGNSGAMASVLAIIQSVVMFLYSAKNRQPHKIVIIGFILTYVACSTYNVLLTQDIKEILPAMAAFCFSISIVQKKPSVFRVWAALNPSFWLAYDIFTHSYVMFLVHLAILTSSLVAMIRIDGFFGLVKKNKKESL